MVWCSSGDSGGVVLVWCGGDGGDGDGVGGDGVGVGVGGDGSGVV